jgi:hypothetical protein
VLLAALVGVIKYDMQRTTASQQATRVGMNLHLPDEQVSVLISEPHED